MVRSFLASILDFFLPAASEVRRIRTLTPEILQQKVAPRTIPLSHGSALALLPYKDPDIRALLWALKYRASSHATVLAAAVLEETLHEEWADAELAASPILLLTIPRSGESMKRYGSNHLEKVVELLPPSLRAVYQKDALTRLGERKRQTTLSRKERLANMAGALSLQGSVFVAGAYVIVLDDIVTTGATLSEARRVLMEAGAKAVSCIALAYS